jgi:hypothetical protein
VEIPRCYFGQIDVTKLVEPRSKSISPILRYNTVIHGIIPQWRMKEELGGHLREASGLRHAVASHV